MILKTRQWQSIVSEGIWQTQL